MAHDVGLHATKGFVLQTIKEKVNPSFLIQAWVVSQCILIIYHGVELDMLGDIVLNPPVPDIGRKCSLPQSLFSSADEGGSVVIPKKEHFKCKVSTASISGLVEILELYIELVVGSNASLDDGPDVTASSQVEWVKGSCLLQLLVCGVSVKYLMVNDRCTLIR